MNILFLTIGAVRDLNVHGAYTDLLRCFANNGHKVYVVGSLEKRAGLDTYETKECGIHVLRVKIGNITKTGLVEKGISTLKVASQYERALNRFYGDENIDLILYTTPPVTLAPLVKKLKNKYNAYTYLLLKDIFPHNSVDLGMISKSGIKGILYKYFRNKEKQLYEISDKIGCMSLANVEFVKEHNPNVDIAKLEECPNTIDNIEMLSSNNKQEVLCKYNLPTDKYILMYGGNFGKPQDVGFIVEAIKNCSNIDNIHFLLCGSGTDFYKVENYIKEEKPTHVSVIQRLPFEEYFELLSCCDIGLLFLDHRFTIPNFPSRLLDYMNSSLPVIAATDKNTDVGRIIEKGDFGWWIESRMPEEYKKLISDIFNSSEISEILKRKSRASKKYLIENYTTQRAYETIMNAYNKNI